MQKETQILPGLKVVGSVDLTKFEKTPKPEPVKKPVTPPREFSRNTIGAAMYRSVKGKIFADDTGSLHVAKRF